MTNLRGQDLRDWLDKAEASTAAAIRSFARGLRQDLAAVTAGLSISWNSGSVEGHVNRIKMLKRQMYGRASFDLLRHRILCLSTTHWHYFTTSGSEPLSLAADR